MFQGGDGEILQLSKRPAGFSNAHTDTATLPKTRGSISSHFFPGVAATPHQLCREALTHTGCGILWGVGFKSYEPGLPKDS